MTRSLLASALLATCALTTGVVSTSVAQQSADPSTQPATPAVGQAAKDFTLKTVDDEAVTLSAVLKEGPAVVVVLRGWPGYQCPICTRQVLELRQNAERFAEAKARVILIYPGPAEGLREHAKEFLTDDALPAGFTFVLDPGYVFTNAWNLRWDAPRETAYPSSFVIGQDGVIRYAKVSHTHGGRAPTAEVLAALPKAP